MGAPTVTTTGVPTGLKGYIDDAFDIGAYGAVVDYLLENTPQLQHPQSIDTYSRMRHDYQLSAVLAAYGKAIGRAHYAVDPTGCRDEVVQAIADDLGLPILDVDEKQGGARRRKFKWREHVRVAGLDRVYGHMFFEQAWADQSGRWRLDVVQERMPQTVSELKLNSDGTLKAMVQGGSLTQSAVTSSKTVPTLTVQDHRLVYYVREREGANYFGQSLLRPAYGPWLIKDQLLRVHATSIRRFGMGIPTAEALPGSSPTPQQMVEAERIVKTIKAGDEIGAAMPPGFRLALRGMEGSAPDALAFVVHLDRAMTRATLCSILDMAVAERGNRSLGETVMDLMVMAQQDDAQNKCDTVVDQIVVPLVDANWGEDEPAPRIVAGDVGQDVQLTAQDFNWLFEYGGLTPDQPLESYLRERYGLPKADPDTARPSDNSGGSIPPPPQEA